MFVYSTQACFCVHKQGASQNYYNIMGKCFVDLSGSDQVSCQEEAERHQTQQHRRAEGH